jgi:CheY-like chemotaxis protein
VPVELAPAPGAAANGAAGNGYVAGTPEQPADEPARAAGAAPPPAQGEDAVRAPRGAQVAEAATVPAGGQARVLVVERGRAATQAVGRLDDAGAGPAVTTVPSPEQALEVLRDSRCECVVAGEGVSKAGALRLLEALAERPQMSGATFLILPDRALSDRERARLRRAAPAITAKEVSSVEQLTTEAALALHSTAPGRVDPDRAPGVRYDAEALRGRKVLLVDDDVRNLFALASLLEDRGMEVVFGETGKEALSALERHPNIDIVLMDIMMPDMDGNETIAAIRRTPGLRDLPIVAVTAKAMEGDRERSLEVGASGYITKPVEPERLLSLIGTWLHR